VRLCRALLRQRQHERLRRTRPSRPLVALEESRQRTYLQGTYPLGPGALQVQSCLLALSADARRSRSGTRAPRGLLARLSSKTGGHLGLKSLVLWSAPVGRRFPIPLGASPRSSWWIFSPSISILEVIIVVLLIPIAGDHCARYRSLRIGFECLLRSAFDQRRFRRGAGMNQSFWGERVL
jgi:hypothetical protein